MQKRDDSNEVALKNYINLWSLETIARITLDRRLGLFDENIKDERAKKLLEVVL